MNQVTHVQHRRTLFGDRFGNVARVEVHQANAGIFYLRAADPVRCVINLVRQTFIATWLEVSGVNNSWFVRLGIWLGLCQNWFSLVYRIAILGDRIRILVYIGLLAGI